MSKLENQKDLQNSIPEKRDPIYKKTEILARADEIHQAFEQKFPKHKFSDLMTIGSKLKKYK